jgi:hypothetical protein
MAHRPIIGGPIVGAVITIAGAIAGAAGSIAPPAFADATFLRTQTRTLMESRDR